VLWLYILKDTDEVQILKNVVKLIDIKDGDKIVWYKQKDDRICIAKIIKKEPKKVEKLSLQNMMMFTTNTCGKK